MITLFTKHDIWDMIENKKMSLSEIQEEIGFEDIGQGYGYKSYTAFLLGKIDENYADEYICYIPEYCYFDETKKLDIDSCYTYQDFKNLCQNTSINPTDLFESCDWQHPSSLLNEIE